MARIFSLLLQKPNEYVKDFCLGNYLTTATVPDREGAAVLLPLT